uniref:Uncharacterized protein n=1 Tax=uncultured bacterium fosmid pJB16B1 TaxID=1478054 RepID=A0A0H3U795_9BACT|nr:hypothetical protein [uncultured bacterium fosmid pJB16B1]
MSAAHRDRRGLGLLRGLDERNVDLLGRNAPDALHLSLRVRLGHELGDLRLLLAHRDLDRVRVCPARLVELAAHAETRLARLVREPDLLGELPERAPEEPNLRAGRKTPHDARLKLAVLRHVAHLLRAVVHRVRELDRAVSPDRRLPGVSRIQERRRRLQGQPLEPVLPGRPPFAPRHPPHAHEVRRVEIEDRHDRRALRVAHPRKLPHVAPLVARRREPVLLHLVPVPSLEPVVGAVHHPVLHRIEVLRVILEVDDRQRQVVDDVFGERPAYPLHFRERLLRVPDDRRVRLMQVRRVASVAPQERRRRVVHHVVGAFAEALHARVASRVSHEKPLVRRRILRAARQEVELLAESRNVLDAPENVLPNRRRAAFADQRHPFLAVVSDAARQVHDREAKLHLLQVVTDLLAGLRIHDRDPRLDDAHGLVSAGHVVNGEFKRIERAFNPAHEAVDVVPHVVRLVEGSDRKVLTAADDRQGVPERGELSPTRPRQLHIPRGVLRRLGVHVALAPPGRNPPARAPHRHLLARALRPPHVLPAPPAEVDERDAAPEIAHHRLPSVRRGVRVAPGIAHEEVVDEITAHRNDRVTLAAPVAHREIRLVDVTRRPVDALPLVIAVLQRLRLHAHHRRDFAPHFALVLRRIDLLEPSAELDEERRVFTVDSLILLKCRQLVHNFSLKHQAPGTKHQAPIPHVIRLPMNALRASRVTVT